MFSWKILVAGVFMFVALLLMLPAIQETIVVGENITDYTADTAHWIGWSETMAFIPIILLFFAVVIPIAAWWKAKSNGE